MKYSYAPGSYAADARAATPPAPPPPPYIVLRAAGAYDLTTPGTPAGILDVAKAAATGASLAPPGGWYGIEGRFALAATLDGAEIVASLALRLTGDLPGRRRRAWVVYARRGDRWTPSGAALLDAGEDRPLRLIGVNELKATLRGEVYTPPPPPRPAPRLRCPSCDRVTAFSISTWRPYTRHRCASAVEGRS